MLNGGKGVLGIWNLWNLLNRKFLTRKMLGDMDFTLVVDILLIFIEIFRPITR
jgi:hypothetical protein